MQTVSVTAARDMVGQSSAPTCLRAGLHHAAVLVCLLLAKVLHELVPGGILCKPHPCNPSWHALHWVVTACTKSDRSLHAFAWHDEGAAPCTDRR